MKVVWANRHSLCQCLKRDRAVLLQQPTGAGHFGYILLFRRKAVGLAAFAGAETARQRGAGVALETYVLAQRMARAAGRTAKDTGGQYGKHELTVGLNIAIENRLPARLVGIERMNSHCGLLLLV